MAHRDSSPLLQVSRGEVKFFTEKGFGFIAEPKGRQVYFRAKHFSGPIERNFGRLDLDLAKRLPYALELQPPQRGEELVFLTLWTQKGPMAKYWSYATQWDKAWRRISGRLSPGAIDVRVRQVDEGKTHSRIVWEGELDKFIRKMELGFGGTLNATAMVEECRATGWMQIGHPSTWQPFATACIPER